MLCSISPRSRTNCYAFAASPCTLCSKLEMSFSLRSSMRTSRLHLRKQCEWEHTGQGGGSRQGTHWALGVLLQGLGPRFSTSRKMTMRAHTVEGV